MIATSDLPAIGSGIEVVKINETLLMGTLVHVITDSEVIGVQDITGAMYWVPLTDIAAVRPFRVGPLP